MAERLIRAQRGENYQIQYVTAAAEELLGCCEPPCDFGLAEGMTWARRVPGGAPVPEPHRFPQAIAGPCNIAASISGGGCHDKAR